MDDGDYNAGKAPVPTDLEMTRAEAQTRARAVQRAVGIYQHVGGVHPARGRVQATGEYLWNDATDLDAVPLPVPRFYALVETVTP